MKKISLFISFSNENGLHARACSKTFKFRLLKQTDLETFLSIQLYLCIEKLLVHNCHVLYVLAKQKKKWKTFGFVESRYYTNDGVKEVPKSLLHIG